MARQINFEHLKIKRLSSLELALKVTMHGNPRSSLTRGSSVCSEYSFIIGFESMWLSVKHCQLGEESDNEEGMPPW